MEKLLRGIPAKDEEVVSESDSESQVVDEKHHARLLDAISTMDGNRRLHHTLRSAHGQKMSESGLKSHEMASGNVMGDMMKGLQQMASYRKMKKEVKLLGDGKVVDAPAPKRVKEKIHRVIGYEKTVKELGKWDSVVEFNRKAPQLKFPMNQVTTKLINTHMGFEPLTDMEKEIKKVLSKGNPENTLKNGKIFTPREEQEMAAMSLEEAKKRRAELLQIRAMMYQKNSKIRWQNKIKSKRYRRARKKEKEKQTAKELEELAKVDPQAVLEKMKEADQKRIVERGKLRHSGSGKFARETRIFAKYDDGKRQQIQDMLEKHRELKKKLEVVVSSSSESEDEDDDDGPVVRQGWMQPSTATLWQTPQPSATSMQAPQPSAAKSLQSGPSITVTEKADDLSENSEPEFTKSEKIDKAEDEMLVDEAEEAEMAEVVSKQVETPEIISEEPVVESSEAVDEEEDLKTENKTKKQRKKSVDKDQHVFHIKDLKPQPKYVPEENRKGGNDSVQKMKKKKKNKNKKNAQGTPETSTKTTQHTNKDTATKKEKDSATTDSTSKEEEEEKKATKEQVLMTIAEAFDDDQVVEDFIEEKERTVEAEREKDIDTFLPGWGSWTGPGIKVPEVVRKRFIKKVPKKKRADNGIGHVIITKKENKVIEKHKLNKVPFPYKTLDHMKTKMSKPIGRTFNTATQYMENIKPAVVVSKIGQIIQPIDESVLLKAGQKRDSSYMDIDTSKDSKSSANNKKKRKR